MVFPCLPQKKMHGLADSTAKFLVPHREALIEVGTEGDMLQAWDHQLGTNQQSLLLHPEKGIEQSQYS